MQTSSQIRTYNRSECITFRKTKEAFGGLSNMSGGYPLNINGTHILTSEALYQACRFPNLPDVQKLIIAQNSPMTAKMKSKIYRDQSRSDWDSVRVKIMRWCLRVKLVQNWDKFGQLLLETGDKPIVEDSHKDDFWGAIPVNNEQLIGINALGRLLMELREEFKKNIPSLMVVNPLNIDNFLFLERPIESIILNNSDLILMNSNNSIFEHKPEEIKEHQENTLESEKENNIFDDYVLPRLEKILRTTHSLDDILANFQKVNRKQMQDWLKLAIELGKISKSYKPVRYIWYSFSSEESSSNKSNINKSKTTKTRPSKSIRKTRVNASTDSKQLSLNIT